MTLGKKCGILTTAIGVCFVSIGMAAAQSNFYQGKTITLLAMTLL